MMCPHFGVCGGCSTQDIPYPKQLINKENYVRNELKDLDVQEFKSILPSPETSFYRNKMEFSFGDARDVELLKLPYQKKGDTNLTRREYRQRKIELKESALATAVNNKNVHLGLHPRKRFNLVTPTPECRLLSKESQKITTIVSRWATEKHIPTYTRHNHKGVLRHLVIREGKNTGQRLVNLFATSHVTDVEVLADALKNESGLITTFISTTHDGVSDVAKGQESKIFWGEGVIQEKVNCISIRVPPTSFMQTNTHASEKMIDLVRSWLKKDLRGKGDVTLYDLYCGAGTIGLNLAADVNKLIGIEVDPHAVGEADINANINNIKNASFTCGRVEDQLSLIQNRTDIDRSFLVVDPPRPGLQNKVCEAIVNSGIPFVAYVSCNPVSLGRDLRLLGAKYRIETVQPMDFFPHTDHVETVVRMSLR